MKHQGPRTWALTLGGVLILPALLFPAALQPVYRFWMLLGLGLGWVNTRILLTLVFYGLFTPMGLWLKLMAKDPLNRGFDPNTNSYKVPRPAWKRDHMTRQF